MILLWKYKLTFISKRIRRIALNPSTLTTFYPTTAEVQFAGLEAILSEGRGPNREVNGERESQRERREKNEREVRE